ncbi:DUF2798 domain-containing protein [Pseudotabrizicola sp. 4114]|uniref:DUF2798 domain-containing protein n=1 Tax=Pseudotabrizicola sp. 4114 TaxID=2817731 RepID=UPI00286707B4|nr:hypothetical protein [Pseudorhodobacter sp. 4114]
MTHSTRIVILAQVFISGSMAALMSGIMSALKLGITPVFLSQWGQGFVLAWPIAFILSLGVGPLAFRAANAVNRLLP